MPAFFSFIIFSFLTYFSQVVFAECPPAGSAFSSEKTNTSEKKASSEKAPEKSRIALIGVPKYGPNATHLEGVNMNAPKAGILRQSIIGNFDSLNGYNGVGISALGVAFIGPPILFEKLMRRSPDEIYTLYESLASSVQISPQHDWIIFHINPKARWSDNKPVLANDVAFTHKILKEQGVAPLKLIQRMVDHVKVLSPRTIKFTLLPVETRQSGEKIYSRELPFNISVMPVLPMHFFKNRDFSKPLLDIPPGSGPYKISDIDMGRKITFSRRDDYWGKDLFVNRGIYNFNEIQYIYYLNTKVSEEAFKAGDFDFTLLSTPQQYEALDCLATRSGRIKKLELPHKNPVGIQSFVMNTRQGPFQSPSFRKAVQLVLSNKNDINKKHYYGRLTPTKSFFENTAFAAPNTATLTDKEKKAVKALKLSDEDVSKILKTSVTQFSTTPQEHRNKIQEAIQLLKSEGWTFSETGTLIDPQGRSVRFEILVFEEEHGKLAIILRDALKPLGLRDIQIRQTDNASYWKRLAEYSFDATFFTYAGSQAPGTEQQNRWHSNGVKQPGTINFPGANSPLIDRLTLAIPTFSDHDTYVGTVQLLDRTLKSENYVVHLFHSPINRLAVWDHIKMPRHNPGIGFTTAAWWWGPGESEQ